jgi:hypothetical protein
MERYPSPTIFFFRWVAAALLAASLLVHIYASNFFYLEGMAIARKLGRGFKKPLSGFHFHGVIIHHIFAYIPFVVRFAMKRLVKDTARLIKHLGGIDVIKEVNDVFKQLVLHTKWAVEYGLLTPQGKCCEVTTADGVGEHAIGVFKEGEFISKDGNVTEEGTSPIRSF